MQCVFVQIRCKPGKTYEVAREIYLREIVSELYSTSGDFDLLAKIYVPQGDDIGVFINEGLLDIPNIDRSLTTLTLGKVLLVDTSLAQTLTVESARPALKFSAFHVSELTLIVALELSLDECLRCGRPCMMERRLGNGDVEIR